MHVPSPSDSDFWEAEVYGRVHGSGLLSPPLESGPSSVDDWFGWFGLRFHPLLLEPGYFHCGIDIHEEIGTPVRSVCAGQFEYSGESDVNGIYVIVSHPSIATRDGFTLRSLYMHLDQAHIRFSFVQKLLRRGGLVSLTVKSLPAGTLLGQLGATGSERNPPHLHLQLEFRNPSGRIIAVDPARMLGWESRPNRSREFRDEEDHRRMLEGNQVEFERWGRDSARHDVRM